jgi:hypothetical protein
MTTAPGGAMFSEGPKAERTFPLTAVAIAAVAIAILVTVLILLARRHGPAVDWTKPHLAAAYADNLEITNLQMSESTSLSGGKSTYIDGRLSNKGDKTVTGVLVQVGFPNDSGMPPQLEVAPIQLIRIREPEVDTQPLSAAPIPPGGSADFRLIFENVSDNWNEQQPQMVAVQVQTK